MHNLNFWHQLEPKELSHGFLLYHVLTQDSLRQLKTLQLREEQFCMITRLKLCHLLQIIPVYVKIPLQLQTFRSQTSSVFFFSAFDPKQKFSFRKGDLLFSTYRISIERITTYSYCIMGRKCTTIRHSYRR